MKPLETHIQFQCSGERASIPRTIETKVRITVNSFRACNSQERTYHPVKVASHVARDATPANGVVSGIMIKEGGLVVYREVVYCNPSTRSPLALMVKSVE